MLQHVVNTLPGKELVGMSGLTQAVKEEGQVVVVVQLLYLHLQWYVGDAVSDLKESTWFHRFVLQNKPTVH